MTRRAHPAAAKPKGKPGRPKKPAVPPAPAAPAAPMTLPEIMRAQVERAKARASTNGRLANHEMRVLRDAWLLDQAVHLWPNVEAAAAELGVSPNTVRGYADDGCPHIEAHSPIPKAPVLAWLLRRAHERGGAQHGNSESIEDAELRIKLAKAAKLESSLVAEAEDRAQQGVISAMAALRHELIYALPGRILDTATATADRSAAEDAISRLIEAALASTVTAKDTPCPPTPTPPCSATSESSAS